jgi:hypothetical protein
MELELAQQRAEIVLDRLDYLLEQRQAMIATHQGEKLYPYLAPLYPDSIRWTGRAALATAVAVKELVLIGPTLISNRTKGNE